MARSRRIDGPYELHPGRARPDRAPSAGRRAAARRPRRSRGDAGRRDLHGVSVRPAAAEPRPLHARPRDGDPEDGVGRRRLAAHGRRRGHSVVEAPRRQGLPTHAFPAAPAREDFDDAGAADRFPVAALAVARRVLQPDRAPGPSAAVRPRDDRQPVPPGAGRAPAAGALLQRVDGRRVRAASTSSRWPA